MEKLKKNSSPDVLRIVAVIFVFWAVMTMAVSIPYVSLGPEEKAPTVKTGGISEGSSYSDSSANYLRILGIAFVSILSVMFILYTVLAIKNKDKEHFKSLFASLLVTLLMVGILLGMSYIKSSGMEVSNGLSGIFQQGSGGMNSGNSDNATTEHGNTAFYAIMMLAMLLVGAVAYLLISSFIGKKVEKIPSQTEELMEKIENAMKDLEDGKKVHDVIVLAYEQMCRILAKSGVKGGDSLTPREFQEAVILQTGISEEPVERLTKLFEEARYSRHPIDDSKRRDAVRALGELKEEMKRHELEESA